MIVVPVPYNGERTKKDDEDYIEEAEFLCKNRPKTNPEDIDCCKTCAYIELPKPVYNEAWERDLLKYDKTGTCFRLPRDIYIADVNLHKCGEYIKNRKWV